MVLVLLAVTLVTIDARGNGGGVVGDVRVKVRDAFSPVQNATHTALRPIGNFLSGALQYGSVKAENQRLRDQIAGLQQKSLQADFEANQARALLAQAHLPFVGDIPTVATSVIDQGAASFENSVTIGKGTASGIAVGQPVVAAGGLVGDIGQVGAHTATVVLLTDPTFVVGVSVDGNPADAASAQGYGRGSPVRVNRVAPQVTLTKGQMLLTSGLAMEKFPKGIPVGRVVSAVTPPGALQQDVTLAPVVDMNRLSYLQVMLWAPP